MFESAALNHTLDKERYRGLAESLRTELLNAQFDLHQRGERALLVLIDGLDLEGKGALAHRLCQWLDPHTIETTAFDRPSRLSKNMPYLWRYWRCLPSHGKVGLVFGSWYQELALDFGFGEVGEEHCREALHEIARFERMLAAERVDILKLWLHLSPEQRAVREAELSLPSSTRETRTLDQLDDARLQQIGEMFFSHTSTPSSPWVVIPAADRRYRDIAAGRALLEVMQAPVEPDRHQQRTIMPAPQQGLDRLNILSQLDFSKRIEREAYRERLDALQEELSALTQKKRFDKLSVLVVFEGADAAGKGGAIRRITAALDPRIFRVHGFSAPSDEEARHPYLWRFWHRLPKPGHFSIFDRSYYGRVLVERVEEFCEEFDWQRAYSEINDFERQLDSADIIVVKFWLAISEEEQLARFKDRELKPFKRYKITEEDWRNRQRWSDYLVAASEMIDRTSTGYAPWHVIVAEDKLLARIEVLEQLVAAVKGGLKRIKRARRARRKRAESADA